MKKALFLDRDGVVNEMVTYPGDEPFDSPQKPEDVVLVEGIVKAIKWCNDRKIPVIEITNQPGVAKGKMTKETAQEIELKVQQLLAKEGAKVDRIYTCPHHPRGRVPELTMDCDCRKPKPGLLIKAAHELNIDLGQSVVLGDGSSDVGAGQAAGCKTIIYIHNNNLPNKVEEARQGPADYKVNDLSEVIKLLTEVLETKRF